MATKRSAAAMFVSAVFCRPAWKFGKRGYRYALLDSGHYIRYYTECSVMADNFLLTAQHMQKVDEAQRLFSLPAAELAGKEVAK